MNLQISSSVDCISGRLISLSLDTTTHAELRLGVKEKIIDALRPHICSEKRLSEVRATRYDYYFAKIFPEFFTEQEAETVATVVSKHLPLDPLTSDCKLSRKATMLNWKVTFPAGGKAFLLLPKKGLFPEVDAYVKRARSALVCRNDITGWKVEQLCALTPKKGNEFGSGKDKATYFLERRAIESAVYARVGRGVFPVHYYDLESTKSGALSPVRTCYYERLISLYWLKDKSDKKRLQQLAVSAAKALAFIHKHGIAINDVKTENMLIRNGTEVIFCDMDLATFDEGIRVKTRAGTMEYYSPQLIANEKCDRYKCDVFAFACALLDLFFDKEPPWMVQPPRSVSQRTLHAYRFTATQAEIKIRSATIASIDKIVFLLIQWAFHPEERLRPSMDQIVTILSGSYLPESSLTNKEMNEFMAIETKHR